MYSNIEIYRNNIDMWFHVEVGRELIKVISQAGCMSAIPVEPLVSESKLRSRHHHTTGVPHPGAKAWQYWDQTWPKYTKHEHYQTTVGKLISMNIRELFCA